jgi:hypothetical protein
LLGFSNFKDDKPGQVLKLPKGLKMTSKELLDIERLKNQSAELGESFYSNGGENNG